MEKSQVKNKKIGLQTLIEIQIIIKDLSVGDIAKEVGYSPTYVTYLISGERKGGGGKRGRKSEAKKRLLQLLGIE